MRPQQLACRLAAVAVLTAGAVHLDLWIADGYRSIHVIGPLFLANAVGAAAVAAGLLLWPGMLTATAGLVYGASTLAAFLLSVYVGLFGFTEVLNGTPQLVAGVAEVAAIALLALPVASGWASRRSGIGATPVRQEAAERRDLHKAA